MSYNSNNNYLSSGTMETYAAWCIGLIVHCFYEWYTIVTVSATVTVKENSMLLHKLHLALVEKYTDRFTNCAKEAGMLVYQ